MTHHIPQNNAPNYSHLEIQIMPLPGKDGFQPFLFAHYTGLQPYDLLPISETPPMPTFRDAEELASVVAWNFIDTYTNLHGEKIPLIR